jgi:hypothetical protein
MTAWSVRQDEGLLCPYHACQIGLKFLVRPPIVRFGRHVPLQESGQRLSTCTKNLVFVATASSRNSQYLAYASSAYSWIMPLFPTKAHSLSIFAPRARTSLRLVPSHSQPALAVSAKPKVRPLSRTSSIELQCFTVLTPRSVSLHHTSPPRWSPLTTRPIDLRTLTQS